MTDFLRQVVEFLRKHPEGVTLVRRVSTEDALEIPDEEGGFEGAILVPEPNRKEFGVYPVPPPDTDTQFTHFIDGIQHSHLMYYQQTRHGFMPVIYGFVSVGVLKRVARQLHLHDMRSEEALYLPLKAFDPQLFKRYRITVHDILEAREIGDTPFTTMLVRAGATVARVRDQLERKMAMDWIKSHLQNDDEWLVIDGSIADLMSSLKERRFTRVIGVSKSHRTGYLNLNWMAQVFSMPAGYRSSVFRPQRGGVAEVYSWYLRLRWQHGASPTYGLVRVEMPVTTDSEETQELADRLSAWLLQETSPLSLPDPRYDRLLYPFRMCEQHLRSRAPSEVVMRTAIERAEIAV